MSRCCIAFTAMVAIALTSFAAEAGTVIADPAKFVTDVYAHIQKSDSYQEPDDIYTDRLAALFALEKKDFGGEVGRLDFDFWTDAQDNGLSSVSVTSHPVDFGAGREVVVAKFKNDGTPEEIHLYFEKTKAGWKLDDVHHVGSGGPWTLSVLLKYGE